MSENSEKTLTMIVWEARIAVENTLLARFEVLGERFGSNADLNDSKIKAAYEEVERTEVVEVLDTTLACIRSDLGKYEKKDVERALRIVSAWADSVGIDVSKDVQHVETLMADVGEPVLA